MTPAEVIAMRDNLAVWLGENDYALSYGELADRLIKSGWVVALPGAERPAECTTESDGSEMLTEQPGWL